MQTGTMVSSDGYSRFTVTGGVHLVSLSSVFSCHVIFLRIKQRKS